MAKDAVTCVNLQQAKVIKVDKSVGYVQLAKDINKGIFNLHSYKVIISLLGRADVLDTNTHLDRVVAAAVQTVSRLAVVVLFPGQVTMPARSGEKMQKERLSDYKCCAV